MLDELGVPVKCHLLRVDPHPKARQRRAVSSLEVTVMSEIVSSRSGSSQAHIEPFRLANTYVVKGTHTVCNYMLGCFGNKTYNFGFGVIWLPGTHLI